MAKVKDGGPAFPVLLKVGDVAKSEGGMSLRDWFAGQALSGHVAGSCQDILPRMPGESDAEAFARDAAHRAAWSYRQADAMIAAREAS